MRTDTTESAPVETAERRLVDGCTSVALGSDGGCTSRREDGFVFMAVADEVCSTLLSVDVAEGCTSRTLNFRDDSSSSS